MTSVKKYIHRFTIIVIWSTNASSELKMLAWCHTLSSSYTMTSF